MNESGLGGAVSLRTEGGGSDRGASRAFALSSLAARRRVGPDRWRDGCNGFSFGESSRGTWEVLKGEGWRHCALSTHAKSEDSHRFLPVSGISAMGLSPQFTRAASSVRPRHPTVRGGDRRAEPRARIDVRNESLRRRKEGRTQKQQGHRPSASGTE